MEAKSSQYSGLYEFGQFRLDPAQRVLMRDGEIVPLAPKAFETLLALVENGGRVVGKDEILKKVWPDTFVEEGSLTQNISILRKILAEEDGGREYIQTIPKRGYRFMAEATMTGAETGTESEATSPAPASVSRGRHTPTGMIAAGLFVAMAMAAGLWWRLAGRAPLTDRDVIVLADFTNTTGDTAFDGTLRDALAYQLEQSPFLKVLDDAVMRQDLALMRLDPQERISNDVAREICVRESDKAMLRGSVAKLGGSYAIELVATECEKGATLAREQAQAADKEHVLESLAGAARGLRTKLGEPLRSIQSSAPPAPDMERVTTGSLEAFQAFRRGAGLYRTGQPVAAVPFFQRATELDPEMAEAWGLLSVAYENSGGDLEGVRRYWDKAWELRDRVSTYERLRLTSSRPGQTPGQYIAHFEEWARIYPREALPVISVGRVYAASGDFEKALPFYENAYRLQIRNPIYAANMIGMYGRLDRFAEAKAVAAKAIAQGMDASNIHRQLMRVAAAQQDWSALAQERSWYAGRPEEYLTLWYLASQAELVGKMRESETLRQEAAELAQLRNIDPASRILRRDSSWNALLGDCKAAQTTDPVTDAMLAMCGSATLARRSEEQIERLRPGVFSNPAAIPLSRAAAAFGLGRTEEALELLKTAAPHDRADPFSNYLRGLVYLRLKQGREAATEFQKILDHPGSTWGPYYPLAYVGLGRAAAMAGDQTAALQAYRNFLNLWKDADQELPLLQQVRGEYAKLGGS